MRFFTDPKGWTHNGKMFYVPIFLRGIETGQPEIVGTNIVYDWLLSWWPQAALRFVNWWRERSGQEPLPGWPILIYEPENEDEDTQ